MSDILHYLWLPFGYFVGAIPFGLLAGKMKGIDIREHGSGNIGATNTLRTLGKPIGLTVFVLDFLKGTTPVLLARIFSHEAGPGNGLIPVLTGVFTVLGHTFPIWLKFKGGKGIATSGGAAMALAPMTVLIGIGLWLVFFYATKYVSIASLVAALTLPSSQFIQRLIDGEWKANMPVLILMTIFWLLATWRHKSNIKALLNGTESRFTKKKKDAPAAAGEGSG